MLVAFPKDSQSKLVGLIGLGLVATPALSLHSSNEPCELSQWLPMMTVP